MPQLTDGETIGITGLLTIVITMHLIAITTMTHGITMTIITGCPMDVLEFGLGFEN
jgi:hypothetical protein